MANPLNEYGNFADGTNIQFKHGPQANINRMIQNGGAIEGAFYLSDDTQKLYVGRTKNGNVYPVQVSKGVTVVTTTDELNLASTGKNNANSAFIEEGDLYYVTNGNILAALEYNTNSSKYEWVQINPPTGINSVEVNYVDDSLVSNLVESHLEIATAAGGQNASSYFFGGNNITIAANSNNQIIDISATDTLYALGTSGTTNNIQIGLNKDQELTFDSAINLTGTTLFDVGYNQNITSVAVNSNNGTVEINGSTLKSTVFSNDPDNGFILETTVQDALGQPYVSNATLQPIISYGENGVGNEAVFANGTAQLNVYSVEETQTYVTSQITSQLATAEALSYKGVLNYTQLTTGLTNYFASHEAHTGDIYKVDLGLDENNNPRTIIINQKKVKTGDMIILNGTLANPNYTGVIPSSALGSNTNIHNIMEIIPSGNETELAVNINSAQDGHTASLVFSDAAAGQVVTELFDAQFNAGNVITITANSTTPLDATSGAITIGHSSVTTNYISASRNSTTGADAFNDKDKYYSIFALAPNQANAPSIETDGFGHITNIRGSNVTFRHNRLTLLTAAATELTTYNSNAEFTLEATDSIGVTVNTSVSFNSNTLQFKATGSTITADLVWGSF